MLGTLFVPVSQPNSTTPIDAKCYLLISWHLGRAYDMTVATTWATEAL